MAQRRWRQAVGTVDMLDNAEVSIIGAQHVVGNSQLAHTLFQTNDWSALAMIKNPHFLFLLKASLLLNPVP